MGPVHRISALTLVVTLLSGVSILASAMAESGGGIHPAVWVAIGVGAVVLVLVGAAYGILRRLARASQRLSE